MAGPGHIADGLQPFAELARRPTTVVYKAYEAARDRFVLLKVLRPEFLHDADLVRRLEDEARLLARVAHPNVVATYRFGATAEGVFLASEFVEGIDVAALLAEHGPLPVELAAFILCETARGLAAAHAEGILHHDLKPANLLVGADGRVKLADFGLAALVEADREDVRVRGTLAYLAPEQVLGEPAMPASDLFSLGVTFFEMLTAEPAFGGPSYSGVLDAVLHHDPLPFLDATTDLPPSLRRVAARLLTKDPSDRYADAGMLVNDLTAVPGLATADDLAAYLAGPAAYREARRAKPEPVVPVASPRRPALWWQGWTALLVIIVFGLAYGGFLGLRAAEPAGGGASVGPGATFQGWLATHGLDSAQVAAWLPPPASAPEIAEAPPPPEPVGFGTLRLDSQPAATVRIDGQPVGTTPFTAPLVLAPGAYEVELHHPSFPVYRTRVEVRPEEEAALTVSLWDQVAAVRLEVSPWAVVLLDGVVQDTVPPQQRPLIVPPGKHLLSLQHPVLGTVNEPLEVAAGEQRTLRFNLHELLTPSAANN